MAVAREASFIIEDPRDVECAPEMKDTRERNVVETEFEVEGGLHACRGRTLVRAQAPLPSPLRFYAIFVVENAPLLSQIGTNNELSQVRILSYVHVARVLMEECQKAIRPLCHQVGTSLGGLLPRACRVVPPPIRRSRQLSFTEVQPQVLQCP
jgi:hypothetical protein